MALAALVPAFAIVMRDQAVERRQARDRVLQENLRLTRLAADQVASAFIGAQRFLQTFSLLPGLASFNPADCAQVAATALRDHPNFSALAMVKPDGAILCSSAGARGLRPVADRDWFRRVMRAKTSVLGEYQISQINGSPVIVVAHPIFDVAGRVQRVLALGIELGGLEQFMSTVKLGKESTISVFDRNRTIVARHPDGERWMGKSVPATQGVQRLFRSEDVDITESIGVDGVRRLYATVPVNTGFDTGLYVGIGIESTAAFAGLNQLLWQQLALLAFLSVTVIGVTLVAGQLFVVRPLDELRAVANRVASGDFSARAHLAGGVSEIRALSDAVDSMAAGLEVREREGERAAAVLRDGEARNSAILDSALDCILTIDTSGRLLDFNPAAERVFGFRRQDVIGREMAELIVPPDLREAHRAGLARYLTTGQQTVLNRRVELRAMRADGSEFPIELSIVPISIAGTQTLFTANLRDITARKEAAAAAAERARMTALTADVGVALNRHESLRASLQACAEAVVQHTGAALARIWTVNSAASVLDLQASAGLYTHVNGAHARIPVGQFEIGRIARDRKPTLTNQVIGDADVHDQEWARREGMVAFAGYPLMIGEQVVGVIALFARHKLAEPVLTTLGSIADHLALGTRRHHAEEGQRIQARQLERTEAEFRSLFAANPLPMWVYEIATWQFLEVNDAAVERYGYTRDEFLSMRVTDIRPAEDADRLIAAATEIPQAWTHSGTRRHLLKSGQIIDVEVTSHGLRFHDKAARLVAASDVTERRRAEETRRLLATIVESSDDAIVGKALDGTILSWNRGAERLYGFSPAEAIGQPISIIIPSSIQGEAPELLTRLGRAEHVTHHETVRRRKDGSLVPISLTLSPIVDAAGHVVAGSAIGRDISERTRAEQALKESEARFRRIAETVTEVFWIAEVGLETMIYVNPAYERIWGRTCESLYRDPRSFLDTIHQDDRARVLADLEVQMAGLPFDHEYRICRPNGDVRWIWNRGFPVRDANESVFQYVGVAQDITERRILEEQFRQSQKMEAIGQLAGGVAHDFNNILTAILGSAEFLLLDLPVDDPRRENAEEIASAGQRAAQLTRQLLAFSRKQILAPRVLHLGVVISQLTPMLRRLLGETIDLKTVASGRAAVMADAGQIEQVVMNLAINARDAMSYGGRLTIETADIVLDDTYARYHSPVPPGDYAVLAVSDTGHGMDEATRQRIFEPFFTTKGPGRGTGLGLATVYGIVKQSGGFIWVYSEVSRGTTFKVYLPRTDATEETHEPLPIDRGALRGHETILLVEDEDLVRDLVARTLRFHGYTVHIAEAPRRAIELASVCADAIDLILTDVVMPDMNGHVMAAEIQDRHPEAKVLCMSGYTDNAILHHGVLDRHIPFLQKPFSSETLLRTVRDTLHS